MDKRGFNRGAWLLVLLLVPSITPAALQSSSTPLPAAIADEIACKEYRFVALDDGAISAPNRAQD
ncbi:MAG TPA: hypothetical protein VMQ62_01440, partial [Dongiaceae bacterium]|nr:hypothetical protein [Dongiaceae bacterium]